jgi:hypothetical protein
MVPLTMALLPAYVDLMTAVNNDVGAVAPFSLFLWACVRLTKRGPSLFNMVWLLAATALCLLTKRTVFMAIPLLGITLLFGFLRGKLRRLAWGFMIFAVIGIIFAVFTWGDAALWYRGTPQKTPIRAALPHIPDGEFVFRLSIQQGDPHFTKLVQILPINIAQQLSKKPVTLGAWIWAFETIEIDSVQLQVSDGNQKFGEKILVTEKPQFFALTFTPQGNTWRAWVLLQPYTLDLEKPVDFYYDGLVLADGEFPLDQAPVFAEDGATGTWGGIPFENLLRNGSAGQSWLYLRPWAEQ